ncbi:MAG: Unknown protein [uncultured Sulfurovum sp.]|uniref:Uncharacterized protein n=1 Tax=uncultured Sulfurovum sp. TaxID=269237 RepID=A0A6S6SZI6_9BACT|nr:MAG: Unknown protein [uncultured Sulfurovum sp.]
MNKIYVKIRKIWLKNKQLKDSLVPNRCYYSYNLNE